MKFLADENFNNRIIRGLLRQLPPIDVARVQDLEIAGSDDATVLAWAAEHNYILLTHDKKTIPLHALARLDRAEPLSGVLVVGSDLSIGQAIDDLLLVATCSSLEDWNDRIEYLPL
jgi:predicted nuclease of predicted toxin-antitoxin system